MASPKIAPDVASAVDSDNTQPAIKTKPRAKPNGDKKATPRGKSTKSLLAQEGLERTDNGMALTSWPEPNAINQKNYYTEYMKRDDQILALRLQNDIHRDRITKKAKDKDRALARTGDTDLSVFDAELDANDDIEEDASNIIVIHMGSQNLRVGFASDALPKTVPMCMAGKDSKNESEKRPARPKRPQQDLPSDEQFGPDFAKLYSQKCNELKLDMRANKRKVLPNSKELVVNYNRRAPPEIIPEHNDPVRVEFTDVSEGSTFEGHAALRIPDESTPRFSVLWPIRYGWLNEDDYHSSDALLMTIDHLIFAALQDQLKIPGLHEFKQYSCVLVIPDLYEKKLVEALIGLFLQEYNFIKVCLIQESLAVSMGAGYATSCVIDIGAQKTSIACVEDGMVLEDSCINLKYGGYDVTETFVKMMMFDSFPYADINLMRRYDFLLAEELKTKFCTMNQAEISVQLYNFHLRAPNEPTRKYQFKTYDEVILAPMGFFEPSIFDHSDKLNGRRKLFKRSYDAYDIDIPNDPISRAQLDTLQKIKPHLSQFYTSQAMQHVNGDGFSTPAKERPAFNFLPRLEDHGANGSGTPGTSNPGSPAPEGTPAPFAFGANGSTHADSPAPGGFNVPPTNGSQAPYPAANPYLNAKSAEEQANERDTILPIAPLDEAIILSIEHAGKGDPKRTKELFGSIMVVGGGAKTPGFGPFLEMRLKQKMPWMAEKNILVGTSPKEMDGQVVAWKGASVFGKLPKKVNDSWIGPFEWERLGARAIHHKVPWNW